MASSVLGVATVINEGPAIEVLIYKAFILSYGIHTTQPDNSGKFSSVKIPAIAFKSHRTEMHILSRKITGERYCTPLSHFNTNAQDTED